MTSKQKYYLTHREECLRKATERYAANRKELIEYGLRRYHENKEDCQEYMREYRSRPEVRFRIACTEVLKYTNSKSSRPRQTTIDKYQLYQDEAGIWHSELLDKN